MWNGQVQKDEAYLRRAISLAMKGRGGTEPNPMVGCVIVRNDCVIGEGYHHQFGGPHAEPTALASCTESPQGATVYVTLEPCCHTDKKTPPCAPRLIEAKVARVVIGALDPNPKVNGESIKMLRAAGIIVDAPLLETESKQLIAPFIAGVRFQRPYVTLKWAQSANGKVAGHLGKPVHITNEKSDRAVHQLRSRCDAIAVGTKTAMNDDPLLTARGLEGNRPLVRVVLSNSLALASTSRLATTVRQSAVLVYCSTTAARANPTAAAQLRALGVQVIELDVNGKERFEFSDVLSDLHRRAVTHFLVEPGPVLAQSLISKNQVDRVWVFRSPREIADQDGPAAAMVDYPVTGEVDLDGDLLTEYLNPASDVFFASVPSVDFLSASGD